LITLSALVDKALDPQSIEALEKYVDILRTVGMQRGLIGPRESDRIWARHIVNSAAIAPLLPPGCVALDLGSGAGLPGVVLAILRPDVRWTLVEPLLRRATFLEEVVDALSLGGSTTVVRERAENYRGPLVDVVAARAVAPLDRLGRWALPLLKPGGALLALKGQQAEDEIALHGLPLRGAGAASVELQRLGGPALTDAVTVIVVRKR